MSQRELARHMRMDAGAMSLMLRGKRKMTVAEATAIAKALGVSVEEVVARAGSMPAMIGRTDDPWGGQRARASRELREAGSVVAGGSGAAGSAKEGLGDLVVPLPGGRSAVVRLPDDVTPAEVERIAGVLRGFCAG